MRAGRALYFSRAPIPYRREPTDPADGLYWQHLGLYVYTRAGAGAVGGRTAEPGRAGRAAGAAPGAAAWSHDRRGPAGPSRRCPASIRRTIFDGRKPTGTHYRGSHMTSASERDQVHLRHRRRRLFAREGHRRRVARTPAGRARAERDDAEVRSLHQRRSRAPCRRSSTARCSSPTTAPRPTSTSATTSASSTARSRSRTTSPPAGSTRR